MNGGGVNVRGGVRRLRGSAWRALNVALLILAAASLAGCKGKSENDAGDDGGGGSGGSGGSGGHTTTAIPVAAASFGQSFATAFCAIGPCCQREGYAFTQSSCETAVKAYVDAVVSAELQAEGVVFDEAAAGGCVEAYGAATKACTNQQLGDALDDACEHVFRGTVPEGGACTANDACADVPGASYVECDTGVCKPQSDFLASPTVHAKLGEACAYTCAESGCSAGSGTTTPQSTAGCWQNDGLYCTRALVCAPLPKVGEACPEYVCAADSYCSGSICMAGVSTGPCPNYNECVHTSYCDDATRSCIPVKANGAACNQSNECLSDNCQEKVCREWSVASAASCAGLLDD